MIESAGVARAIEPSSVVAASAVPAAQTGRARTFRGAGFALGTALATRALVWAAALATIAVLGENEVARHVLDPAGLTPALHAGALHQLLAPAARWDSVWYLQIAAHGYFSPASANFYPLYPLLVHFATPLVGNAIAAGTVISLASMVVGLTLLYRLARLDLDESAARLTVLLVAVFPTSLFFSAVYPSSLYLMLVVGAVYGARRDRWVVAGACGGLAAVTRSNGILVLIVLALIYLYGPRGCSPRLDRAGAWWRPRFPVKRDMAWLALVPAGLAVYLGYLWLAHGAPLAPFRAAHVYWYHAFGFPMASVVKTLGGLSGDVGALLHGTVTPLGTGDTIGWQARNLVDLLTLALAVAGIVVAWRRVPRVYVIYAIVTLVQVTSFPAPHEPMIGIGRYVLPMFALFMGAGAYLAERPVAARFTLATSTVLLVVLSGFWGYWSLVP